MARKRIYTLNQDEIKLLQFISYGLEYKDIALKMYISVDTVKAKTSVIRKKLNATSRANAVYIATKYNIIK